MTPLDSGKVLPYTPKYCSLKSLLSMALTGMVPSDWRTGHAGAVEPS
jgi:hypothetical protein